MASTKASYRSVHITGQSDASSAAFNPFDEDNYTGSLPHTTVGTSDITFTAEDGKLTFAEAGDYLIAVTIGIEDTSPAATDAFDIQVKVEGSEVFPIANAGPLRGSSGKYGQVFAQSVFSINAGDELEIIVDDQGSANFTIFKGTSVTVQRTRASYGNLRYTANPNVLTVSSGTGSHTSYDSDNGGTVVSKLNSVSGQTPGIEETTFTAAVGGLGVPTTSTYLVLSSLYGTTNHADSVVTNIIDIDGSSILSGSFKTTPQSPPASQVAGMLYDITADSKVSRVTQMSASASSKTYQEAIGSGLTVLDLSSRTGGAVTSPTAKLSMLLTSGSIISTGTDSEINIWGTGSYADSTMSSTDLVSAENVTHSGTGRLSFNEAGDYLLFFNTHINQPGGGFHKNYVFKIFKNTEDTSTTPYYEAYSTSYPDGTYPDYSIVSFIYITAAQGDYIFTTLGGTASNSEDFRVGAGTTATIVNLAALNPVPALNPASIPVRTDANEWSQPAAPPPPLFTGAKERDLVKQVNDELIERVIGQTIAYYPIDVERTYFHNLYGEAVVKTFLPPVAVKALVEYEGLKTEYSKNIGLDKTQNITIHFHKRRLTEDQDLFVREGDFVYYGDSFYEIVTLSEPKLIYGQVDHKLEISAKCIRAREGLFDAT